MPNIPQITAPVSNSKSYSFTNRQYDGNIEPFDMVELAQPIKASTAQDNDSAAAMMMGRKNLAPLTVQIKDPTMAVETLKNLRNNGIRALNLDEGDELVSVRETDGEQKILIATHDGMAVVFDETDVRAMGRTAVGVRGIKLREGDYVVGAARAQEGKEVLTITEKGYGKKTPVEEYRITNRGGLGIKNYMVTEKTGGIVGVKVVDGSEDLLLVTRAGILIRTPVEAIRTTGRATQGVIVMRFKEEGDSVISMALTEHEEDDEV